MTKRIFRSICIVAVSVLISTIALFMCVLFDHFSKTQMEQLKMQADVAAQGLTMTEDKYQEFFSGLNTDNYRITWINKDGRVLFDSHQDHETMENHLERKEIKAAIETGEGESNRYSSTLLERSLYYAKALDDGTVIRLSISQSTVISLMLGMLQPLCVIIAVALVLSILLAVRLSNSIVDPLNTLDLHNPLDNAGYDELSPLLHRIDVQNKKISHQAQMLRDKRIEFEQITNNMKEALVLLDNKDTIVSLNQAAEALFNTKGQCIGNDFLTIERRHGISQSLKEAKENGHSEIFAEYHEKEYRLDISNIESDGVHLGVVILASDVSEQLLAEKMRREFTANVSHELKTPLHSIAGYAEIMANGMVKQEDYVTFSEKIYTEAKRMVSLVEDIINLSHLDEGASDMQREDLDILMMAENVVRTLQDEAAASQVTISATGESSHINGVPQLVHGIIYNLCDNAIKYNRVNGSVEVSVKDTEKETVLTIKDSGIGVPKEHQTRIFERFYRVDKSRSKMLGGTGLGLSIVKHAAKIHHAKVEFTSVIDEGTTVIIRFPK